VSSYFKFFLLCLQASREYAIAPEYLKNFQRAVNAIGKYQQDNTSLESSFKVRTHLRNVYFRV